jgi:hypothetical protein
MIPAHSTSTAQAPTAAGAPSRRIRAKPRGIGMRPSAPSRSAASASWPNDGSANTCSKSSQMRAVTATSGSISPASGPTMVRVGVLEA